jgi:hypothetical protein
MHCREVLRREQVTTIAQILERAVDNEFVRQPTCLCALAAIRAPLSERFAREALPRIGDAQRTVDESFQRDFGVVKLRKFAERGLAGNDDAFDAKSLRKRNALGRSDGHLRRSVNVHVHAKFARQNGNTEVLHDHHIHASVIEQDQFALSISEFVGEDKCVERAESANIVLVKKAD